MQRDGLELRSLYFRRPARPYRGGYTEEVASTGHEAPGVS